MPDLGTYAVPVLTAYAGSLLAIVVLVWLSVRRARRVKATLDEVERD